ncbi:MAG: TetR/AcrR family transcriptional regulator [Terracidiphilus sp.]|nr:TetR/AcrR family transcriptional regulator [Terracidiphilus sp.]
MVRSQQSPNAASGLPSQNALEAIPRAGRRQRRAVETRVRIFRAALKLIAERELANVTVEDITEAADVGKGTFFNYFPTKEHVLGVMAEIQIGKIKEAVQKASAGTLPIHGVLHGMILRLAEEPGRSPSMARALLSSFLANEGVREVIKAAMLDGRSNVAQIIAAGQQSGEIDPSLEPIKVATSLLQSTLGTILFWSLHELPSLAVCLEDTFQQFWRSVAVSPTEQAL